MSQELTKKIFTTCALVLFSVFVLSACQSSSPTIPEPSPQSLLDAEQQTLGACDVVTKPAVEAAVGKSVMDPKSTGSQAVSGAVQELCIYGFDDIGIMRSFYVNIEQFTSETGMAESQNSVIEGATLVSVNDEQGYFVSTQVLPETSEHQLTVHKNGRKYVFAISVDRTDSTFTSESARQALVKIAQAAKY